MCLGERHVGQRGRVRAARLVQVESRWRTLVPQRQHSKHCLDRTGSAEQVASSTCTAHVNKLAARIAGERAQARAAPLVEETRSGGAEAAITLRSSAILCDVGAASGGGARSAGLCRGDSCVEKREGFSGEAILRRPA